MKLKLIAIIIVIYGYIHIIIIREWEQKYKSINKINHTN